MELDALHARSGSASSQGRPRTLTLGLAGDTMLGRGVAARLAVEPPEALFSPDLVAVANEADLLVLNLECAISTRGERWPDPRKPFFFRAPPIAVEALRLLGVDCVTLANNHALDYGQEALLDTFEHLSRAGIAWVGAGESRARARDPVVLEANGLRVAILGVTDHPAEYAATERRPGVAFADLWRETPAWLLDVVRRAGPNIVLVTPHWGPNMTTEPVPHVRRAARDLLAAGATLVAGHSAHVFHGVTRGVLYDLGDLLDDYAVDPVLRNDYGLFFLVTLDEDGPRRVEAIPLELQYCHTQLASPDAAAWIERRFTAACAALGSVVVVEGDRLVVDWR